MVFGTGAAEIADSEDEPLTSSPAAVSDAAVDKLSPTQRQDVQARACSLQEPAAPVANERSSRLDVDRGEACTDFDTTHIDSSDLQPAYQETNTCTNATADSHLFQASVNVAASNQSARRIDEHEDCVSGEPAVALAATRTDSERASAPADVQHKINDNQQSSLLELPAVGAAGRDVKQAGTVSSHTVSVEPAEDNPTPAFSAVYDNVQGVVARERSWDTTEAADAQALTEHMGRETTHEASVCPTTRLPIIAHTPQGVAQMSTATGVSTDATIAASGAADLSYILDLDKSLGDTDLAMLHTGTSSAEASKVLGPIHEDRGNVETVEPVQVTDLAAFFISPLGAESTSNTNDFDSKGISVPKINPVKQGHAADGYEQGSERTESGSAILESAAKEQTTDETAPARVPPKLNTQEAQGSSRSTELPLKQVPDHAVHASAIVAPPPHHNGPEIDEGHSLTPDNLQSTASQASEPLPPRPPPELSPQEITLAELKAQKAALLASLKDLPAIQVLIEESQNCDVDMSDDDGEPTEVDITAAANKIVKEHIKLLHDYNELKDVGQGLMGLIADQRGVRIVEVQDEFGIDADD